MSLKLSVVIPTYNREKTIERSVNSILNQKLEDWELIIIDDCSTDNTIAIVQELIAKDNRIKLFQQPENGGANRARNKGIELASASCVTFLDSDDVLAKNTLLLQYEMFSGNKKLGVCYVGADYYCGEEKLSTVHHLERGNLETFLFLNLKGLGSSTSGFSVRKEVFNEVGNFDDEMVSQQDLDFLVRAARYYYIDFLEGCNTRMYVDSPNRISDNNEAVMKGEIQFMNKHEQRIQELGVYHHVARKLARKYALYQKDLSMAYSYLLKSIQFKPLYFYAYVYALKLPILYFKR